MCKESCYATGACNRRPPVSVLAKQSSTQPVLAQEKCWVLQNWSEKFTTKFQLVVRWTQIMSVMYSREEDLEE